MLKCSLGGIVAVPPLAIVGPFECSRAHIVTPSCHLHDLPGWDVWTQPLCLDSPNEKPLQEKRMQV
uniref:Secreted protein n=1 Tax=Romanomermis culicivorax TaxID=13658 RepID=A0A915J469_ROMCU